MAPNHQTRVVIVSIVTLLILISSTTISLASPSVSSTQAPLTNSSSSISAKSSKSVIDASSSSPTNSILAPGSTPSGSGTQSQLNQQIALMSQSHIQFTLDLLTSLTVTQLYNPATRLLNSVVISPASIQSVLMMLHLGAKGLTKADLAKTMHLPQQLVNHNNSTFSPVHDIYGQSIRSLLNDDQVVASGAGKHGLNIANGLFVQKDLQVASTYQLALRHYHSTQLQSLDFTHDSVNALNAINEWIEKQTRGEIRQFMGAPPSPITTLMAVNALYFKGDWKYRFDPQDTETNAWFYQTNGKTASVPMMVGRLPVHYGYNFDLKTSIIELPYKINRLSMFMMLPDDHRVGLFQLLRHLNSTTFTSLIGSMRKTGTGNGAADGVSIRLPKFNIESMPKITNILRNQLGLRSLFSNDEADLSGMFMQPVPVHVTDFLHKAILKVDETGSQGAAVSATIIERVGTFSGPYFEADHPFLFFLMDKQTGLVLFAGIYGGPAQDTGSQPGPQPPQPPQPQPASQPKPSHMVNGQPQQPTHPNQQQQSQQSAPIGFGAHRLRH